MQLPYKRTVRQFKDNSYSNNQNNDYIDHPDFADNPSQYIRGFMLIQKDIQNLFDYIEPADQNLSTFSYRVHELFIRTCIEIEANFKAILTENGFNKRDKKGKLLDFNIIDYRKVNISHKLSSYEVHIPNWWGTKGVRKPYKDWIHHNTLTWYRTYNLAKHDRHKNFQLATFENLIDSVCGLIALLSSQFFTNDFSSTTIIVLDGIENGLEDAIGDYFRIKFPLDWADDEKYDFEWHTLSNDEKQILKFDYNKV